MKKLSVILFCLMLAACTWGDRRPVVKPSKTIIDSIDKNYPAGGKDSADEVTPSLSEILKECLANYRVVTTVDTTFATDSGALQIHLRHFCAYDSGITLPNTYTKMFGLKSFATHNFITDVILTLNGRPVYVGRVTRDDFLPLVDGTLKKYGSLIGISRRLQPSRSGLGVVLSYSFSIPLTDVGREVSIDLEPNGARRAFTDYGFKTEKAYPDSLKVGGKPEA